MDNRATPIEILLVEDNPTDVLLTRSALEGADIATRLHVVSDGEQAMAFLRREDAHASSPTPDLVLLDLNLPKKDGREVLEDVKSDPQLRRIPVIVLTTSDHEVDIERAYALHANSYIKKPVDYDEFARVVRGIQEFWFAVATLPRG